MGHVTNNSMQGMLSIIVHMVVLGFYVDNGRQVLGVGFFALLGVMNTVVGDVMLTLC